jgi:hypothetical protein
VAQHPSFGALTSLAFTQIRQNAGGQQAIYDRIVQGLSLLERGVGTPSHRIELARQAALLSQTIEKSIPLWDDRKSLLRRLQGLGIALCDRHRAHPQPTRVMSPLPVSETEGTPA